MNKMTLTYFDIDGGRAEPVRLAMSIAAIDFDDERFPFSEFPAIRERTPLRQVPVLTVNGEKITQSNSILRYVGKLAGLYPADDFSALLCDEILE